MTPELDHLIHEVTELTGVPRPEWLEAGAPLLDDAATRSQASGSFYLIGIIGGKDVGKSALVNAIVGDAITAQTSHGPGTETVIAYAHESQAAALTELLDREVPGKYSINTHRLEPLIRQVLLDLPDIDSHYLEHLEVTRKMLRHMLFPIWVQSVEKYADRQPQQMLAKVAAGNAPENFVFCLNKVDQVDPAGKNGSAVTSGPIGELQDDFAQRLSRTLGLKTQPKVWAISAIRPERYELPALRAVLAQQKSTEVVRESKEKAHQRQRASVFDWLGRQQLTERAARLARLQDEANEYITERIGGPLLEGVIPRLVDDAAHRQSVVADCMNKRVGRWPIVNVLHTVFAAIGAFTRRNAEARPRPPGARISEVLVDEHLAGLTTGISAGAENSTALASAGPSLAAIIQTTFALLQQTHPALGPLYQQRKLWESAPADMAAAQLRNDVIATLDRQRAAASARACGKDTTGSVAVRGLLTIGALIWFPVIQPVLSALLTTHSTQPGAPSPSLVSIFVNMLGIDYLIKSITSLLIYYSVIWLILKWDTQRRVNRQFIKWKRLGGLDATLNLPQRALAWIDALLEPIRTNRQRLDAVVGKMEGLRESAE